MRGPTGVRPAPVAFLLGPARSGTSLVYRALCLHPQATYISNYVRRLPGLPELAALNRVPRRRPGQQRAAWFLDGSNAYVYGRKRSLQQQLMPAPVEGEPVFRACGLAQFDDEPTLPRQEQVDRLRRRLGRLVRADGRRVLLSKRISHNRRIPLLSEAFPDARYVAIVRDGRAVAASLKEVDWWPQDRVWWYGGTPVQWAAAGGDPWELCARNWVEDLTAMEAGLSHVDPAQVLSVRYEDFIADPLPTLATIAEHVGLRGDDVDWHERLSGMQFPDQNVAWRRTLTADALSTVEAWQAPMLRTHGYASTTTSP